MGYDARQAMTVALYNAEVCGKNRQGEADPTMLPFELADKVLRNLKSMGWLLDGYLHETRAKKVEQLTEEDPGMCKHPECCEPAVEWGVCATHFAEAMEGKRE